MAIWDYILHDTDPGKFYWPIGYPFIAGLFGFVFSLTLALQLVNLLALYLSIILLIKMLNFNERRENSTVIPFVIILFGLCPFVLKASLVAMSDLSALCLTLLSFYYFWKFLKYQRISLVVMAMIAMLISIQFRYASGIVLFIPFLYSLYSLTRVKRWKVFLVIFCFFTLTMILFIYHGGSSSDFYADKIQALQVNPINLFKSTFHSQQGLFEYKFPNIIYSLEFIWHPGFLFFSVPVLFFWRKIDLKSTINKILLASILLYIVFIGSLPQQNHRFLLPIIPFYLVLIYPCWQRFMELKWLNQVVHFPIILIIVLQIFLFIGVFNSVYHLNQFEKQLSEKLNQYDSVSIYAFGVDVALKTYVKNNEVISLWDKEYPEFPYGQLVVFNEDKLSKQWEGKTVMNNWNHLKNEYNLVALDSIYSKESKNYWKIYAIR